MRKNRIFALVLAITMVFALTSCGGSEESQPEVSDKVTVDEATGLATFASDDLSISFPTEVWAVAELGAGEADYSGVSLQSQELDRSFIIVAVTVDENIQTAKEADAEAQARAEEVYAVVIDRKTIDGMDMYGYEYSGSVLGGGYTWRVYLGVKDGKLVEIDIQDGTGNRAALNSPEVETIVESLKIR